MKALPALIFSLLCLGSVAQATSTCEAKTTGPDEVELTLGSHRIHVIGWLHLDQKDIDVLRDGFNETMKQAEKDQCLVAKSVLTAALTKQTLDVKEAQSVYKKIEARQGQKPLSYVGVEATPAEMTETLAAQRSIADGLKMLEVRCGMMIAPEIAAFSLVMPGPEYAFYSLNPGLVLLTALEDQAPKQKHARQIASKKGNSGLHDRDQAIAKNALSRDGDGVLVLGKMHVMDVANELVRQCKTRQ